MGTTTNMTKKNMKKTTDMTTTTTNTITNTKMNIKTTDMTTTTTNTITNTKMNIKTTDMTITTTTTTATTTLAAAVTPMMPSTTSQTPPVETDEIDPTDELSAEAIKQMQSFSVLKQVASPVVPTTIKPKITPKQSPVATEVTKGPNFLDNQIHNWTKKYTCCGDVRKNSGRRAKEQRGKTCK